VARVPASPLQVDDYVWVAVADVRQHHPDFETSHGGSVASGKLLGRTGGELAPGTPRTWIVSIQGLHEPVEISSRKLRRHCKALILRVGDWDTEQTTLNPLAASLKAQLSLLLPPSAVDVEYIRTLDELSGALRVHGGGLSPAGHRQAEPWGYAILVGHGRAGANPGIRFGTTWHSPQDMADAIKGLGPGRRSFSDAKFISLCCETGAAEFASVFSDRLNSTWTGPGATVHSFEAAGFVVRFFYEHFLRARTWADAFGNTRKVSMTFSTQFRCWMDGEEVQPVE
jgi:hypothetical protein